MVYDLETQTHSYLGRKASPWHPDNYIVAAGWKVRGDKQCSWDYNPEQTKYNLKIPTNVTMLVGFNLKFDMLWQWDNPELIAFFKRGGAIWDCQYVEYLLNGQDHAFHYPSLTTTAPRYGGTEKIDEVKVLWDAGVQTSDINKDLLLDYLVGSVEEGRDAGDVGNTEKIFLGQIKKAKKLNMIQAIKSRMDGLCATTEMEWQGLKIDTVEAKKQFKQLSEERVQAKIELQGYVPELPDGLEFNWGSGNQKSCLIYGGVLKYEKSDTYVDEATGKLARLVTQEKHWLLEDGSTHKSDEPPENTQTFKSGKRKGEYKTKNVKGWGALKTKKQDFFYTFEGFVAGQPEWKTKKTDGAGKPIYKTDGDTIALLEHSGVPFCSTLANYESLNKELNTYFLSRDKQGKLTGMLTTVDQKDNRIHHNLNHCATVTSRLSSNNPNLQNIPRADKSNIKRLFVSRYGDDGQMLEADYSQLEVVVQGVLTNDTALLEDLRNRVDFHCKRVAIQPKHNITYDEVLAIIKDETHIKHSFWKKMRTSAKIFSFQRAYGAGAPLISAFTGMTVDEVKELIEADERTYPGVLVFNDGVEKAVNESATSFYDPIHEGVFRKGTWQAPTGCLYTFRSFPAKDWQLERGVIESFNPTNTKNYPIQGTGGEIVQGICGKLWRHFVANDNYGGKAVVCNTVHDCVWIDCHKDVSKQVSEEIRIVMESVDDWFRQFDVEITVPFPVDVEIGPNMLDLKHA